MSSRQCPVSSCSRTYFGRRSRDSLRDHLREFGAQCGAHKSHLVHNFPSKELGRSWCRFCAKLFSRKSTWKRHEDSHSKKNLRCPICPRRFNQKRLVKQHVSRGHGEEANDIQVVTFGNLSSQDVSGPQIETLTRPPSETEPQTLVDVNYARGSEDSFLKKYGQPRNAYDVTSFDNLGSVFGSWGFGDGSDNCTTSAGLRPIHQPFYSGFPAELAQTSLDPISSVFCTWQAGTDINTLPQLSLNTGQKQHARPPIRPLTPETAGATNSQSHSNYIPAAGLQTPFDPASSQSHLGVAQTRNSVDSLFCTWEAGIDMNALPQLTVDAHQGGSSRSSVMPPITPGAAANNLDSYDLDAHSTAYSSSLVGQTIPENTQGSFCPKAVFCTWEAGAGPEDHSCWDEPASLKASPNLGGMQLMVSKSTVMDRPVMEQRNPHQHCQSDPTEILQGISKSSVTWRNTVMNPWNNQQFSRNGQPFSAKGKRLAHALARENTPGLQKRKSAAEALPRKRQRPEMGLVKRPCLPTPRSRQDLVAGEEQAADSHSPARDTRSSSFQSDSFASTPSITESQQSLTLNRINYEVVEQPVASAQDLNRSYNLQPRTNQLEQGMSSRLLMRETQQQSGECIQYFTQDAGLISTASISAAPFADNEFVSSPNCNDVQGFFSDRSRVMHSPSPPQVLLVAEEFFHNIKVYFKDSCQNMIFDDHGTLLNPNGADLHNDLCNEFDSYCFTATMFKGRELHVEFRHALSKASALVEQILRAEHPRTLACFLKVFIHLIQIGLPDVTSILRDFIKKMSEKVTRRGHPWGQICRLLGELDSEPLDQAMAQIWKCTTDTFESELGASSRLAVSVRLDYIKRVYGFKEYLEEEQLLRDLLAQFDGIPRVPTPRVMLNLAHNLNRQGRHDEAEKMAVEVFSLLQQNEIYAKRIAERIECMKTVSYSQFNQGKALVAERTIREAIQMIVDQWGIQHSWVLEFMNVLEGWLQDWGREEDANILRGEIRGLMGKYEIDEQLDGIQGLLIHPAGRK